MDAIHMEYNHSQDSSCFLSSDFSEASDRAFYRSNEEVSKMAKKTIKQSVSGIEKIKNELMAQITGLTEVDTDQADIHLTKEIEGKKNAVNVHINQPDKDGKVLVEIQLLAKPIVNVIKKVEITITAKQNELISTVKRSICCCRILSGIKMEIDSIVKDFEAS